MGLTEAKARETHDVVTTLVPFEAAVRPIIEGRTFGFCKLVADRGSCRILGCHVVGERAVEIAQLAAVAMAADMRVDDLARVAVSFPTYAEVLVHAAVLATIELGLPLSGQAERVRREFSRRGPNRCAGRKGECVMDPVVDPVALARVQFAANITFHILFPTITIALGWFLLFFKLRFAATGEARWMAAYGFWIKVFALSFALGVVSGVTMSFQFGTNWPGYMNTVGNIAGPLLGYEVLTAFFLEATFLGIMLFGRRRVGERMHTLATFLVAVGTTASAFWILALNSWMQTPAAFRDDRRPGARDQLVGRDLQSLLPVPAHARAAGLGIDRQLPDRRAVGLSLAARRPRRRRHGRAAQRGDRGGAADPGADVRRRPARPEHTASTSRPRSRRWKACGTTERGAPLRLIAFPDEAARTNRFELAIPKGASLILTHSLDGEIKGLDEFPDHPPVAPLFWGFRVMVGTGVLMLAVAWLGVWQLRRGGTCAPVAAARADRDDLLGLGGHHRRLVRHRDRPPALAGVPACCAPPMPPRPCRRR